MHLLPGQLAQLRTLHSICKDKNNAWWPLYRSIEAIKWTENLGTFYATKKDEHHRVCNRNEHWGSVCVCECLFKLTSVLLSFMWKREGGVHEWRLGMMGRNINQRCVICEHVWILNLFTHLTQKLPHAFALYVAGMFSRQISFSGDNKVLCYLQHHELINVYRV